MGGVFTINKDQENEIRRYLFGQMAEADEESLELRLLTEPAFVEEFDTVVDEVTDQYVREELTDGERRGVEESYLSTPEGRQKVRFTSELLERAAAERGAAAEVGAPGFFDRVRAFWQVQSLRVAAITAAVVIIAAGVYLISFPSKDYAMLSLAISSAKRGEGPAPSKVKIESGVPGVEVTLAIPEQAKGASDYRATLVGDGPEQALDIDKRDEQTLTIKIPASLLNRGQYAINLSRINPDGSETRIPGSYYFNVE